MSASFKIDISSWERLANKFHDPKIREELLKVGEGRDVAALVAQAIADNFDKEGPGWPPLKAQTIRRSVNKKLQKKLAKMTDEEIEAHEARSKELGKHERQLKKSGYYLDHPDEKPADYKAYRKILQKTRLLYKTATTPFATQTGNGKTGNTTWTKSGPYLVYEVNLIYAGVHNSGNPKRNIRKREFLTLSDKWRDLFYDYLLEKGYKAIEDHLLKELV